MENIFDHNLEEGLKKRIKLVAKILNFPYCQFVTCIKRNKALQDSIMQHDIAFYENALDRLNALPEEEKWIARAELQHPILGMPQEAVQRMAEHMEDMYYR